MADPILEEIWRVRQELIKRHGGLDELINSSRNDVMEFLNGRHDRFAGTRIGMNALALQELSST